MLACVTTPPTSEVQRRSRLWLWIVLPLIVTLLSCVGAAGGAYLARRDTRSAGSAPVATTPAPSGSASPSAASAQATVVSLPKALLGRARTTDRTLLASAEKAARAQRSAEAGTTQVVAAYYGSFARKNLVFVLAVQGKVVDPEELYATVTAALESQRKGLKLAPVEPGPLGGRAACGDSVVSGGSVASCVWVDSGSYAFVEFFGVKAAAVKAQFVQARGQLETVTPA
jgi:hypothetical protein